MSQQGARKTRSKKALVGLLVHTAPNSDIADTPIGCFRLGKSSSTHQVSTSLEERDANTSAGLHTLQPGRTKCTYIRGAWLHPSLSVECDF